MLAAKNSNDCSTHRWTTHQRQKSVMRERLLDAGQRDHAEDIEDGDVDRGRPDQVFEPDAARPELAVSPAAALRQVGHRARNTSTLQTRRPSEEADLPEAAELDIGQALIAEPEPAAVDVPHDAKPVADQRAGDDDQRHPEQQIDQQPLAARLAAAGDGRREEQAGADPGDADPDDRRLDVDVAQEIERQVGVRGRARRSCAGHNRRAP